MEDESIHYNAYDDDYMRYDKVTRRYILTERAIEEKGGIALRERLTASSTLDPTNTINAFLRRVSDLVYGYINDHCINIEKRTQWIASIKRARDILQQAMIQQATFMCINGDLTLSTKPDDRANAIDRACISVLNTIIPELGVSLLYLGA